MMNAHTTTAAASIAAAPIHSVGRVLGREADAWIVGASVGVLTARRAASCLLQPEPGDSVLVSGECADEAYIIAVLERAPGNPARLTFDGDTRIEVEGGSMSVSADAGVSLSTPARLTMSSDETVLRASRATVLVASVSAVGRELLASIGEMKIVGTAFESIVDRVRQFARHSFRTVEDIDQVRSRAIDYRADELVSVRGGNVVTTARELVKLDGQQVHIG
jgi:uncharacterized protein DUF3540